MLAIASAADSDEGLRATLRRGACGAWSRCSAQRVDAFNAARVARSGLEYPRYEGGFFVSVFTPDAERTAALCRDLGVFVVPLEGAVRVALCSTPTGAVPRLVDALAKGVEAAEVTA